MESLYTPEEGIEVPRTRRRRSQGWQILAGVLVLVIIIIWVAGRLELGAKVRDYQAKLGNTAKTHAAERRQMVEVKALSLAHAMRMVNPILLTELGEQSADQYLLGLLDSDPQIEYVVIYDSDGVVRATTNMRLRVDDPRIARFSKVALTETPLKGADVEAISPIIDTQGVRIGTVRVGLTIVQQPQGK